jgi:hypothetical protein
VNRTLKITSEEVEMLPIYDPVDPPDVRSQCLIYVPQYHESRHPSLRTSDHNDGKELSSRGIVRCEYPGPGTSWPGTLPERETVN